MFYVGIDVAKEKHYVCILDDTKEIIQTFLVLALVKTMGF